MSGLFVFPVLLIHAQPYDDSELRAFLMPPEGCPAPCFMGIRPGVTTVNDARGFLQAQPSLADTVGLNPPFGLRFRANHPHDLIADSIYSYLEMQNGIVRWLRVHTNISVGEIWAAYGQPDWATAALRGGGVNPDIFYTVGYDQHLISFSFTIPADCWSGKFGSVLQQKVTFLLGMEKRVNTNARPQLWLLTCDETLF